MGSTNRHATTTTITRSATTSSSSGAASSGSGAGQTDLLTRLHASDSTAFDEMYRTHLPALKAHVAARLKAGDQDVVADLVHDAFADALGDPTLLGADVPASLRRLCDRACARYLWSQRQYLHAAHTIYADQYPARPAARPGPVEALAALPDSERQVTYLRFLDGHTPQATARLLGRSVRSVIYLERRARWRLREHLTNTTSAPSPPPANVADRA